MNLSGKELAESIAIISVVLSLLFVGYELRLSRSIAIFDGAIAAEQARVNVRSLQIEQIDIWQKGCAGGELSTSEAGIFNRLVDIANFRKFTGWRRANLGMVERDPEPFAREMALERHKFLGFNTAWLEVVGSRQNWGPWELSVDSIYESLNSDSQNSTPYFSNCG